MVIVGLSIWNNLSKIRYFKKIFLLADNTINVILGMRFLALIQIFGLISKVLSRELIV